MSWGRRGGQLINTIFQKDIGYSKLKTSPVHFVKKPCLNIHRRECVSGAPPKFPSCVPAPHHEAGSPSSSHPSQAACCYATWRVPLATSVPQFLSFFLSTKTDHRINSRNPWSTVQVCFFRPFVNCFAGSTEEIGSRATGFYKIRCF